MIDGSGTSGEILQGVTRGQVPQCGAAREAHLWWHTGHSDLFLGAAVSFSEGARQPPPCQHRYAELSLA
jgi:hypothetical protein